MRLVRVIAACAVLFATGGSVPAAADGQLVFVVRHAERASVPPAAAAPMSAAPEDPPLSAAGQQRADRLAQMLRSASIRRVIATEFLRTRQTAAPTAQAAHLEVLSVPAKNADALIAALRSQNGNVLVVGHSNTVPELLQRLGIKEDIAIADTDYDNLFIVVRPDTGEPSLIRLRY